MSETSTYGKNICHLCGRITSAAGFAMHHHLRMHTREGYFSNYGDKSTGWFITEKPFDKSAYQKTNRGPKDNPFKYYE